MDIKYLGDLSTGTPFETGDTRAVIVTSELCTPVSGYEGDTITYTATVLDDETVPEKLPATFVATLKINGTDLVINQVFNVAVYNQTTGVLTIDFIVPVNVGLFTVKLHWAEQFITP